MSPRATGLLALLLVPCLLRPGPARAEKAVLVVRHAEKAAGGGDDPGLSEAGTARAERLAETLRSAGVTAVVTSEKRRAVLTAAPTARALGLTPRVVDAGSPAATIAAIDAAPADAVVLVVGHSNTVPELLKRLGAPSPVTLDDADFGSLFVVVRPPGGGTATVVRLRY